MNARTIAWNIGAEISDHGVNATIGGDDSSAYVTTEGAGSAWIDADGSISLVSDTSRQLFDMLRGIAASAIDANRRESGEEAL